MRPKLKVIPFGLDKAIDGTSLGLLIALWVFTIYALVKMPDTIPTHYNISGQVDDYGSKFTILLSAFIPTALFAGITTLSRYPHIFNYPTEVTEANASYLYTLAVRLLRFMKLAITFLFGEMVASTYFISVGAATHLSNWFLPVELLLLIVPGIIVTLQAKRKKVV